MAHSHEVMIQNVDTCNANIYFDGLMYVGGRRHIPRPAYFAPYFTNKAADQVPEIMSAGIGFYSRVFTVQKVSTVKLKQYPAGIQFDQQIRGHENWASWQRGLQAIAKRAVNENWNGTNDPCRLYFLEEPLPLNHTIQKDGYLPMIPWGFGTSVDRLRRGWSLRDLKE